jgi:hypothetical protein
MSMSKFARRSFPSFVVLLFGVIGLLGASGSRARVKAPQIPRGSPASSRTTLARSCPVVTITATSTALQVASVTSVSDERGEYRLSPLPIGTYLVLFELPGFQNIRREGVRLTVGFNARVDAEMNVGAVSETITVSGASPLVDTTNTATSTELTREQLEVLPTSRDGFHSFMNQVPGVRTNLDVGSSGLGDTVQFKVYGQFGSPWQMLEGVLASAPTATGDQGSHVDFNAIDGTRVQTVGSNAEMPRRGLLVDAVIKSGGNDFHGTGVLYGSGPKLEGNNIDESLEAAGIRLPALHTVQDIAGNVGGRIVRNKLWFFGGGRYQKVSRDILDAFDADGTPITNVKKGTYYLGKGSYQVSAGNRLTGFYHTTNDYELRGASKFMPRESMLDKVNPVWMAKGEWQAVRGNSLVASVQFGRWDYAGTYNGLTPGKVSTTDIATLYVTGNLFTQGTNANGRDPDQGRHHTKGVVSWYKPDLLGGNHEFKAGLDHLWSWLDDGAITPSEGGAYQLRFNNGVPFQLATTNAPLKGYNHGKYLGVYGQDSWTLARRLTLNLGLRFEHDNAFAPAQCHDATPFARAQCWDPIELVVFNSFAPRAHVALDVMGDGKTVLKGGYGRFNQLRELSPDLTGINQNVMATTIWDWHDNNGNKQYEAGEVNLDPNGPDFRSIAGTTLGVVNPDEKQPKTDEFSLTFERELVANTAVRVTGFITATSMSTPCPRSVATVSTPFRSRIPTPGPTAGSARRTIRANRSRTTSIPAHLAAPRSRRRRSRTPPPRSRITRRSKSRSRSGLPEGGRSAGRTRPRGYTSRFLAAHRVQGSAAGIRWLVYHSVPDESQPGLQHDQRHPGMASQGVGGLQPPFGILASANYDIRSGNPRPDRYCLREGPRFGRSR